MNWGILGCGEIAKNKVAPAMLQAQDVRLHAVMRRNRQAAEAFAAEFGVPYVYDDAEDLLKDPAVHGVYISAPVKEHAPLTMLAAKYHKHVICEKPMAWNGEEAMRMVHACAQNNVLLAVAYYRRFYPKMQQIRALLADGAIGAPISAYIQFHDEIDQAVIAKKPWIVTRRLAGGGAGMDVGCHMIDLLCHCLGEWPVEVSAQAVPLSGTDVERTLTVMLQFAGGCTGVVSASFGAPRNTPFIIYGTQGRIEMESIDDAKFTLVRRNGRREQFVMEHAANMYVQVIENMMQAIDSGAALLHSGADCARTSLVLDAAYLSAERQEKLRLP